MVVFLLDALRPNFPPTKYIDYPYSYKLHERTTLPPPVGSIAEVQTLLQDDFAKEATSIAKAEDTKKSEKVLSREEGEVDETLPKPLTSALWTPGLDSLDKTTTSERRGVRQLESGGAVSNEDDVGDEPDGGCETESLEDVKKVNATLKRELAAVRKRCYEMDRNEDQQRLKQRKLLEQLQATVDVVVPPAHHMEERFQSQREQLREEQEDAIKATMYTQMDGAEAFKFREAQLRDFQLLKSYEDALYEKDRRRHEDQVRRQLERKDEARRDQQLKFKQAQRDAREFRTAAELAEVTPLKEVTTQPRTTTLVPLPQPNTGAIRPPPPRGASLSAPARPVGGLWAITRTGVKPVGLPTGAPPPSTPRSVPAPAVQPTQVAAPAPAFLPGAPPSKSV